VEFVPKKAKKGATGLEKRRKPIKKKDNQKRRRREV
jgi:hypothetical protein